MDIFNKKKKANKLLKLQRELLTFNINGVKLI